MLITKKSFQDPPPLTEFSGSVHWDHIVFGVDSISVTVLGISRTNHHFLTKFAKYRVMEIMENLENHKKVTCMEKSWNLKKNLNNHREIMEYFKII